MPNTCISYPSIWTYKTDLPENFLGIHVLTDVGFLYAKKTENTGHNSYLPLRDSNTGALNTAYITKCLSRDSDSSILCATLSDSDTKYPASFIFNKVWGPSAVLIVTPPANETNRKDLLTAIKFIHKNMALGAILLAYTPLQLLLYPDKDTVNDLLLYYNRSINNNTQAEYKQLT